MIEANRLSNPGERAALVRVEAIAARADGLQVELFAPSGLALLDPDERARLVAEVKAEADRTGRRQLLDEVCGRVSGTLQARLSRPVRSGPVGLLSLTPGRPDDEAALITIVTDAIAVAVMEDRLQPVTAARLSAPGRTLLGLPLLGGLGGPSAASPLDVPEPSPQDWADAAAGGARAGVYTPFPVGHRVALATIVACTAGPIALFIGAGVGQTGAGILAGLAVVALCWLAATYRG